MDCKRQKFVDFEPQKFSENTQDDSARACNDCGWAIAFLPNLVVVIVVFVFAWTSRKVPNTDSDLSGDTESIDPSRTCEVIIAMLKRALAFNGSGRKEWNTSQLATKFLDGARSTGASTELVHLSDLQFSGCHGCLSCKLINTATDAHCQLKDDLTRYLDTLQDYQVVCFATPIFFFSESGMMRACVERILFQFLDYHSVLSKYRGSTKVAYIASMNVAREQLDGFRRAGASMGHTQTAIRTIFGNCEVLYAFDTLQVTDYAKYHITMFDEAKKREHNRKQFGVDLQAAFDLGARLVRESV
jgi:multimeric flavodoxin WrbA